MYVRVVWLGVFAWVMMAASGLLVDLEELPTDVQLKSDAPMAARTWAEYTQRELQSGVEPGGYELDVGVVEFGRATAVSLPVANGGAHALHVLGASASDVSTRFLEQTRYPVAVAPSSVLNVTVHLVPGQPGPFRVPLALAFRGRPSLRVLVCGYAVPETEFGLYQGVQLAVVRGSRQSRDVELTPTLNHGLLNVSRLSSTVRLVQQLRPLSTPSLQEQDKGKEKDHEKGNGQEGEPPVFPGQRRTVGTAEVVAAIAGDFRGILCVQTPSGRPLYVPLQVSVLPSNRGLLAPFVASSLPLRFGPHSSESMSVLLLNTNTHPTTRPLSVRFAGTQPEIPGVEAPQWRCSPGSHPWTMPPGSQTHLDCSISFSSKAPFSSTQTFVQTLVLEEMEANAPRTLVEIPVTVEWEPEVVQCEPPCAVACGAEASVVVRSVSSTVERVRHQTAGGDLVDDWLPPFGRLRVAVRRPVRVWVAGRRMHELWLPPTCVDSNAVADPAELDFGVQVPGGLPALRTWTLRAAGGPVEVVQLRVDDGLAAGLRVHLNAVWTAQGYERVASSSPEWVPFRLDDGEKAEFAVAVVQPSSGDVHTGWTLELRSGRTAERLHVPVRYRGIPWPGASQDVLLPVPPLVECSGMPGRFEPVPVHVRNPLPVATTLRSLASSDARQMALVDVALGMELPPFSTVRVAWLAAGTALTDGRARAADARRVRAAELTLGLGHGPSVRTPLRADLRAPFVAVESELGVGPVAVSGSFSLSIPVHYPDDGGREPLYVSLEFPENSHPHMRDFSPSPLSFEEEDLAPNAPIQWSWVEGSVKSGWLNASSGDGTWLGPIRGTVLGPGAWQAVVRVRSSRLGVEPVRVHGQGLALALSTSLRRVGPWEYALHTHWNDSLSVALEARPGRHCHLLPTTEQHSPEQHSPEEHSHSPVFGWSCAEAAKSATWLLRDRLEVRYSERCVGRSVRACGSLWRRAAPRGGRGGVVVSAGLATLFSLAVLWAAPWIGAWRAASQRLRTPPLLQNMALDAKDSVREPLPGKPLGPDQNRPQNELPEDAEEDEEDSKASHVESWWKTTHLPSERGLIHEEPMPSPRDSSSSSLSSIRSRKESKSKSKEGRVERPQPRTESEDSPFSEWFGFVENYTQTQAVPAANEPDWSSLAGTQTGSNVFQSRVRRIRAEKMRRLYGASVRPREVRVLSSHEYTPHAAGLVGVERGSRTGKSVRVVPVSRGESSSAAPAVLQPQSLAELAALARSASQALQEDAPPPDGWVSTDSANIWGLSSYSFMSPDSVLSSSSQHSTRFL